MVQAHSLYTQIKKIIEPSSLDLYLAKLFIMRFLVLLLGLATILQMLDLLSRSDDILAGDGAQIGDLWRYALLRFPQIASQFSPFTALLAAIFTFVVLNQHSEIIIIKASGWSAFRIILPMTLICALIACLHFAFNETIVVDTRAELYNWENNDYAVDTPPAPISTKDTWVAEGNTLIKVEGITYNGRLLLLDNVTQYIRNKNLELTSLLHADFAVYREGQWSLFEVKKFNLADHSVTPLENMLWQTQIAPERFLALSVTADHVSLPKLASAIGQLRAEGHNTDDLETSLLQKIVAPLSTVIMPLMAGIAAFGVHRSGTIFARIMICLALGFGFFIANNLFIALGQFGTIPPWIAAWLPMLLFTLTGGFFILFTEE